MPEEYICLYSSCSISNCYVFFTFLLSVTDFLNTLEDKKSFKHYIKNVSTFNVQINAIALHYKDRKG